jgi:hypothetical protein
LFVVTMFLFQRIEDFVKLKIWSLHFQKAGLNSHHNQNLQTFLIIFHLFFIERIKINVFDKFWPIFSKSRSVLPQDIKKKKWHRHPKKLFININNFLHFWLLRVQFCSYICKFDPVRNFEICLKGQNKFLAKVLW